jgi:hypothetical protein
MSGAVGRPRGCWLGWLCFVAVYVCSVFGACSDEATGAKLSARSALNLKRGTISRVCAGIGSAGLETAYASCCCSSAHVCAYRCHFCGPFCARMLSGHIYGICLCVDVIVEAAVECSQGAILISVTQAKMALGGRNLRSALRLLISAGRTPRM